MTFFQVSDAQLASIWFACLAWLNSDLPIEQKNTLLEEAFITKLLDSNQPLAILVSGLPEFDEALLSYSRTAENNLKALESSITTGSKTLDKSFKTRIQRITESSFSSAIEEG
jgi:hypothetical protein